MKREINKMDGPRRAGAWQQGMAMALARPRRGNESQSSLDQDLALAGPGRGNESQSSLDQDLALAGPGRGNERQSSLDQYQFKSLLPRPGPARASPARAKVDTITPEEYKKYFIDRVGDIFQDRYAQYVIDPDKLVPGDILRFYCSYNYCQSLQHHTLLVKENGIQVLKRPWCPEEDSIPKEFASYAYWLEHMCTNPYGTGSWKHYKSFIERHTLVNKKIARKVYNQAIQHTAIQYTANQYTDLPELQAGGPE